MRELATKERVNSDLMKLKALCDSESNEIKKIKEKHEAESASEKKKNSKYNSTNIDITIRALEKRRHYLKRISSALEFSQKEFLLAAGDPTNYERVNRAMNIITNDDFPAIRTISEVLEQIGTDLADPRNNLGRSDNFNSFVELLKLQYNIFKLKYKTHETNLTTQQILKADVKFLVFSGGGAKGNVYGGALQSLRTNGMLDNIEAVAGSSAGAMTAAFAAAGVSDEILDKLQSELTKEKIMKNMDAVIEEGMKSSIRETISRWRSEDLSVSAELARELGRIEGKLSTNEPITFGDIAVLRAIDPIKFKHVHITATNAVTGELQIFTSEDPKWNDLSVAKACLASSALPKLRSPVVINGHHYIDGGVLNNLPITCFERRQGKQIIFGFDPAFVQATTFTKTPYNDSTITYAEQFLTSSFSTGIYKSYERYVAGAEMNFYEVREHAFEAVVLDTGGIRTIDFNNALAKNNYLGVKGEIQTQEYLNNYVSDIERDYTLEYRKFLLKTLELNLNQEPEIWNNCKKEKWEQTFRDNIDKPIFSILKDCFKMLDPADMPKLQGSLAKTLNDPSCSPKVKEVFLKELGVKFSNLPLPDRIIRLPMKERERLSSEEMLRAKIANYEFSSRDFESIARESIRELREQANKPPLGKVRVELTDLGAKGR